MRCGLLYRQGQGAADLLCFPAGGGLQAQVLPECHDGPLGGHFGLAKMGSLVRRLAFWVGQDVDVAEYVPAHQGGAWLTAWPPPFPAAPLAARRDDWSGLDRWAADDGGRVLHDSEPC